MQQDLIRNAVKCVPRHAFYRYDAFWGRAVESTANTYLFQCVVFLTAFRREDGKPVKTCLVFFFFFSPGHCARAHCKNICFDRGGGGAGEEEEEAAGHFSRASAHPRADLPLRLSQSISILWGVSRGEQRHWTPTKCEALRGWIAEALTHIGHVFHAGRKQCFVTSVQIHGLSVVECCARCSTEHAQNGD